VVREAVSRLVDRFSWFRAIRRWRVRGAAAPGARAGLRPCARLDRRVLRVVARRGLVAGDGGTSRRAHDTGQGTNDRRRTPVEQAPTAPRACRPI
jgi:hypothetical protein